VIALFIGSTGGTGQQLQAGRWHGHKQAWQCKSIWASRRPFVWSANNVRSRLYSICILSSLTCAFNA